AVVVDREALERAGDSEAGVGDNDVELAQGVSGLTGGALEIAVLGDVAGDHDGAASGLADLGGERLETIPAPGRQRHVATLTREFSGQGGPDTRRGARDEDRVAGKRWQRSPNGALWILEDDGLFGVGDGGLGLADRVAVIALGLGGLVVGPGLGQELLGF